MISKWFYTYNALIHTFISSALPLLPIIYNLAAKIHYHYCPETHLYYPDTYLYCPDTYLYCPDTYLFLPWCVPLRTNLTKVQTYIMLLHSAIEVSALARLLADLIHTILPQYIHVTLMPQYTLLLPWSYSYCPGAYPNRSYTYPFTLKQTGTITAPIHTTIGLLTHTLCGLWVWCIPKGATSICLKLLQSGWRNRLARIIHHCDNC